MEKLEEKILIDGIFTPQEAKEILLHLLFSKIHFHTKKNLGSMERTGESDPKSERRIEQLIKTEKEIKKMIANLEDPNKKLAIKSTIQIELI